MSTDDAKRNGPQEEAVGLAEEPPAGYAGNVIASPSPKQLSVKRVAVFVDGFNLYYGLHDLARRKYLWLDLHALAMSLLAPNQRLVAVHYFTARVRNNPEAGARQALYLRALRARNVDVIEGRFQRKSQDCRSCGASWDSYEEKETDVNLCLGLVEAAHRHEFDVGLIISGDSDMVPAVKVVKGLGQSLRLVAVFPPKRNSGELKRAVDAHMNLGKAKIRQAQLPDEFADGDHVYKRPNHWQ